MDLFVLMIDVDGLWVTGVLANGGGGDHNMLLRLFECWRQRDVLDTPATVYDGGEWCAYDNGLSGT